MTKRNSRSLWLAGLGLTLSLTGLGGCSHGSDDTGGNSSMGSMSGTTGRQYTQSKANQDGTQGGGSGGGARSADSDSK